MDQVFLCNINHCDTILNNIIDTFFSHFIPSSICCHQKVSSRTVIEWNHPLLKTYSGMTHLSKWLKLKNTKCWQEFRETGELIYCRWKSKWLGHFVKLLVSYKTKYAAMMWTSNCTVGHLFQRNRNIFSQKPVLKCL